MVDFYTKISRDLSRRMKNTLYSIKDICSITGCGHKTVCNYTDSGIIRSATTGAYSNRRLYTQEDLDKFIFIYDIQKSGVGNSTMLAALYDYMKSKRVKIDVQAVLDRIEDYKSYTV